MALDEFISIIKDETKSEAREELIKKRQEAARKGARALNSNPKKKLLASKKAAATRGYDSLAAAGRKGGLSRQRNRNNLSNECKNEKY